MSKAWAWIGGYGALLAAFAGGVLVGALLRYPAGWVLPDSSANVIGAAAGSLLSVGGAFIVLRSQLAAAEQARSDAKIEAFKHFADVLVGSLLETRSFLSKYPGLGYDNIYSYAEKLHGLLSTAQSEVDAFDTYRFELGLEGTRVYRYTRIDFESLWTRLLTIRNTAALAVLHREARAECHRQYQGLTATHNRIVKAISEASGDPAYLDLLAPDPVD